MTAAVRLLQSDDAESLGRECLPGLPRDEVVERVQETLAQQGAGTGFALVAVESGRVGVHARLVKSERVGWVHDVASHPDFRGRGIFQELMAELIAQARRMGIERLKAHVRADNSRARRAYEKAGFRCAGQDGMRGEQLRYEIDLVLEDERVPSP